MKKEVNSIVLANGSHVALKNKKLFTATKQVFDLSVSNSKNSWKLVQLIGKVKNEKLYNQDFPKFEEYTQAVLGMNKSQSYNYAMLAEFAEISNGKATGHSIIHHEETDYTTTKILVLKSLGIEQIKQLDEEGIIDPLMTVEDLKAIAEQFKVKQLNEGTDEESEESAKERENEAVKASQRKKLQAIIKKMKDLDIQEEQKEIDEVIAQLGGMLERI